MDVIIMAAIAGGVISLMIVGRIFSKRPVLGFGLMIIIPAILMASAYFFVATQAERSHDADVAMDVDLLALHAALEERPDDLQAVSALSGALIAMEDYDAAIQLIENRPVSDRADTRLKIQLSTAYFAMGLKAAEEKSYGSALDALGRAEDIAPRDAPFREDLSIFINQIGLLEQARNKARNTDGEAVISIEADQEPEKRDGTGAVPLIDFRDGYKNRD